MNKRYLIALFLCAACTLSGCGGEQPPDTYSAAEDSLPSLTALVSPAGDPQCTEQTEDGAVSYCYTGLDNTVQAVTDYRQALETYMHVSRCPPKGSGCRRTKIFPTKAN